MSGGAHRSLNLDELMAKIRDEVSARDGSTSSSTAPAASAPSPAAPVPAVPPASHERLQGLLATAARYAPLSSLMPEFVGWGLLKRGVAVPLSRGVMYLSRFITNKQALFNQAILEAVQELSRTSGAGGATPEALESLRVQVRRLKIDLSSLRMSAPSSADAAPGAPASVAMAARLESLTARMDAAEELLARLVPSAGRKMRPEP